jgi:NurA-like 5'-3' nuclease
MIKKAYEEIIIKYPEIKRKILQLEHSLREELNNKVRAYWKTYEFLKEYHDVRITAIDGGMYAKELRAGILYLVNSEALSLYKNEFTVTSQEAIFGILRPGIYGKELVREIMTYMEAKVALDGSKDSELILMDGSLKRKLEVSISANDFIEEINSIDDSFKDLTINIENEISFRKQLLLKKLLLFKKLIENYYDKILWISKVSRSTDLFNYNISDTMILEMTTNEEGYTLPKIITFNIPLIGKISMTSFYARLDKNEKVLRIDIIGEKDEMFIRRILNILKPLSIHGYPYPLLKVHADVRISKEDRNRILEMLGLKAKKSIDWWPDQLL